MTFKNREIGLFILATIIGISGGFITKPIKQKWLKFSTYYALSNGLGGFVWVSDLPKGTVCKAGQAYCTIVLITPSNSNERLVITDKTIIAHSPQHSVNDNN